MTLWSHHLDFTTHLRDRHCSLGVLLARATVGYCHFLNHSTIPHSASLLLRVCPARYRAILIYTNFDVVLSEGQPKKHGLWP